AVWPETTLFILTAASDCPRARASGSPRSATSANARPAYTRRSYLRFGAKRRIRNPPVRTPERSPSERSGGACEGRSLAARKQASPLAALGKLSPASANSLLDGDRKSV